MYRGEIYERIMQENKAAAEAAGADNHAVEANVQKILADKPVEKDEVKDS